MRTIRDISATILTTIPERFHDRLLADIPGPPPPACAVCNDLGYVRHDTPDRHHEDFGKLFPCGCQVDAVNRKRSERLERISGLNDHERLLTISDLVGRSDCTGAMIERSRRVLKTGTGFWTLWGGPGNGKTLLLQAMVNEFRERLRVVSVYATLYDLIEWMREGNAPDATRAARERFQEISRARVLAVDEMEKARMTDYADEFRTALMDARYRQALAGETLTLFAMNCDPATLPAWIWDRLRDGRWGPDGIMRITDASMRPAQTPLNLM